MNHATTPPSARPAPTSASSNTFPTFLRLAPGGGAPAPRRPMARTATPVPADRLEPARSADDRVAPVPAVAGHARVAEREVELHRVARVRLGQPPRNLLGHPPRARA